MKAKVCLLGLFIAFFFVFLPPEAQAQYRRTWVSNSGVDTNLCYSPQQACATFERAITQTGKGGEIDCLNSGDFSSPTSHVLLITQAIAIRCVGVVAVLKTSCFGGIQVQAGSTDLVLIEGLSLDNSGSSCANSYDGIYVSSGALTYIINCTVRQFSGRGVVAGTNSSNARVLVRDSNILNNQTGIASIGTNGGNVVVSILNTLIDSNTGFGIYASTTNGGQGIIGIANSVINGGPTAIFTSGGGAIYSVGPSNIVSGAGSFTGTSPPR